MLAERKTVAGPEQLKTPRYPWTIGFDGSYSCPLACNKCSLRELTATTGLMSVNPQTAIQYLNTLKSLGFKHIIFGAGEPSLWQGLVPTIQYLRSIGLTASMVTNGVGLTPERLSALDPLLSKLILSVDSMHNEAFNQTTNGHFQTWQNVLKSMSDLCLFEKRVHVNTTLSSAEKEKFPSGGSFLYPLKAELFYFQSLIAQWNIYPLSDRANMISEIDFADALSYVIGGVNPFKIESRFPQGLPYLYVRPDGKIGSHKHLTDGTIEYAEIASLHETPPDEILKTCQNLGFLPGKTTLSF
jgi:MoaA/NifB/PqqE/SkfB family radical SAM enzyme